MKTRPQLYISASETHVEGKTVFDHDAAKFLERLNNLGIKVFWKKEWRDYKIIEKEIASSDALLAIVDSTWTSSTWMASEVTWAMGQCGAIDTGNPKMKPIPVFLYPVLEKSNWPLFPREYKGPMTLSKDIEKAALQICKALQWP